MAHTDDGRGQGTFLPLGASNLLPLIPLPLTFPSLRIHRVDTFHELLGRRGLMDVAVTTCHEKGCFQREAPIEG